MLMGARMIIRIRTSGMKKAARASCLDPEKSALGRISPKKRMSKTDASNESSGDGGSAEPAAVRGAGSAWRPPGRTSSPRSSPPGPIHPPSFVAPSPACAAPPTPLPTCCIRPEGEPAPDGPPARCPSLTTLAPAALTAQLGAPPRSDDDVASSLAALRSALEGDAEGTAALEELGVAVARSRAEVEVDDGMLHLARPADFGTPTRPTVARPLRTARRLTAVRGRD